METEHIDKLFLELSQFTKATTKREADLTARLAEAEAFIEKHKCQSCGGVRVKEAELCSCIEAAKGGRDV